MRTSLIVSIIGLTLMGCQQIAQTDLFDPMSIPDLLTMPTLEFEWVEPLEFQNKLRVCRSQDTCSADQLF
jgi:hypothetical protein